MTIARIKAVGFCAHYSRQGDWAFDYARRLAQKHGLQLNVFHFLDDPYAEQEQPSPLYSRQDLARIAFEKERELRMYYDERAGDFVDVGFRLCFDDSWRELHRCLHEREFQVLVLGKPSHEARFCKESIETFADTFISPVVLVGPDRPDEFRLNSRAALMIDRFDIPEERRGAVEIPTRSSAVWHGQGH